MKHDAVAQEQTEEQKSEGQLRGDESARPIPESELHRCFEQFKAASRTESAPTYEQRIALLRGMGRFVKSERKAIREAISKDFGNRSRLETDVADCLPVLETIRYIEKNLKAWMKPEARALDRLTFPLAQAYVIPQPLGVVGIIVPWNFPLNLSLIPLAYAIASGNRAIIKMSENSSHLARLLKSGLSQAIGEKWVQVFSDPDRKLGPVFSSLAFDHILFTGSAETGKQVMAAAARNLCPVTLELGGKSPAIVAEDFPLEDAVQRICLAKFLNVGQICTSVDHVWIPKGRLEQFISSAQEQARLWTQSIDSESWTSIIDQPSFDRLLAALEDARARGHQVIELLGGPDSRPELRKLAPHLVINPSRESELMRREIFGPILPVLEYGSLDEVIEAVQSQERPLALYPFTRSRKTEQLLIDRCMSGGVTVNDTLLHVAAHDLPFGGVGESGMGHYHGREGFLMFSKLRPVLRQGPVSFTKWLTPANRKFVERFVQFMIDKN